MHLHSLTLSLSLLFLSHFLSPLCSLSLSPPQISCPFPSGPLSTSAFLSHSNFLAPPPQFSHFFSTSPLSSLTSFSIIVDSLLCQITNLLINRTKMKKKERNIMLVDQSTGNSHMTVQQITQFVQL